MYSQKVLLLHPVCYRRCKVSLFSECLYFNGSFGFMYSHVAFLLDSGRKIPASTEESFEVIELEFRSRIRYETFPVKRYTMYI